MFARRMRRAAAFLAAPVTVVHTADVVDTTSASSYTFPSAAIGAAAADRIIAVGIATNDAHPDVTAVTVGGVSLTQKAQQNGGDSATRIEAWAGVVPTGTSANIVVTLAATSNRCGIGVDAVYGASLTLHDTAAAGSSADGTSLSDTINVAAKGAVCAYATHRDEATLRTYSWASLTETYDEILEGIQGHSGASKEYATAQTALDITCTISSSSGTGDAGGAMVAMSFKRS